MPKAFEKIKAREIHVTGACPPLDAEFKPARVNSIFESCGLSFGRSFGSKTGYRNAHPESDFIPNANVFSSSGKLWWGDVDIREDAPALEKVASMLKRKLYVTREFEGRFEGAKQTRTTIVLAASWFTGGASAVPGAQRFFERTRLSKAEAGTLLRVSPLLFRKRLDPKIALIVARRMHDFVTTFDRIARRDGFKNSGAWWRSRRSRLNHKSPLSVLQSGGEIFVDDLTPMSLPLFFFASRFSVWSPIS